jgi:hypothetical protein
MPFALAAGHRNDGLSRPERSRRRALFARGIAGEVVMLNLMSSVGGVAAEDGLPRAAAAHVRLPLCEEAIGLARLLLQLFPAEPEILCALLLQHERAAARLDSDGAIVLLEEQDRRRSHVRLQLDRLDGRPAKQS